MGCSPRTMLTALVLLAAVACSTPTGPTISMTAAKTVGPNDGTVIASTNQPVTLTVQNAVSTSSGPATDTFELATDQDFAKIILTKSVPQSTGTQTSVTLDPLAPATYYWRVRAGAGGAVVTSAASAFRIAAVLEAPALALPANGALIGYLDQPVLLTVQNPAMPPTATAITHTFEVAADAGFTSITVSQSVRQTPGAQTSVTLSALPAGTKYYWRVRVTAPDAISATSATASFTVGPAVVSGISRLTIHAPYRYDVPGGCSSSGTGIDFSVDGTLAVNTPALVFTVPGYTVPLTMRLVLSGSRLSGGAVGAAVGVAASLYDQRLFLAVSRANAPFDFTASATISGSISPDGRVAGELAGSVYADNINPVFKCSGTFTWSLAPR